MALRIRPGFWFFSCFLLVGALGLGLTACPSSDDDDDSGEGEGEGEGEVCDPRICSDPGEQCCDTERGSECFDTDITFQHCGDCAQACNGDLAGSCVEGECRCGADPACAEGTELCCAFSGEDRQCIDPLTNTEACGACNNHCAAPDTTEKMSDRCVDGACVCGDSGTACTGRLSSICCPDEGGGASCHDIQTDIDNCGGCSLADRDDRDGHVRGDGELDSHHACDPIVGNICRLASCVCGIPKDIGQEAAPCEGTRQSTCCAPSNPQDADLAACANLDSDEAHCGECNNPCGEGEECIAGACG